MSDRTLCAVPSCEASTSRYSHDAPLAQGKHRIRRDQKPILWIAPNNP